MLGQFLLFLFSPLMDVTLSSGLISGPALAVLGAALAAALGGIGSSIGSGIAGKAASGVTAEKPELFGKLLVLEILPGSQGIYGLVGAFLVTLFFKDTLFTLTPSEGAFIFFACLPLALTGLFSGIFQGKVAATGAQIIARNPDGMGKAITFAAIVETFAIFGLLITFLLLNTLKDHLA